jgi:hypothetical protein
LQVDAVNHAVSLTPHVPAGWTSFVIHSVHVGSVAVDFQYHKTPDSIVLETKSTGAGDCWVNFSPALSLRAKVVSVEMNGRPLPFKVQPNGEDQHVSVRFPAHAGSNRVVIRVQNDFGVSLSNELPPLGSASRELRVLSESWNPARTQLTVDVSGLPGMQYELEVWNPSQISSIDSAMLSEGKIHFEIPGTGEDYQHHTIVFHFGKP